VTLTDERQRDRAVELARRMRMLAAAAAELPSAGALAGWARSVSGLRDELAAQFVAGRVLRVLDVCAHLFCNRLGVPPVEEAALRRLAAAAVGVLAGEEGAGG
jgi:hypothetical protein